MSQERVQQPQKRPRGTPTFLTPTKPSKRRVPRRMLHGVPSARQARRRLAVEDVEGPQQSDHHPVDEQRIPTRYSRRSNDTWSNAEIKALVEFILFHCEGNKWPSHHRMEFWNAAAAFVMTRAKASHQRSGKYHDKEDVNNDYYYVASLTACCTNSLHDRGKESFTCTGLSHRSFLSVQSCELAES